MKRVVVAAALVLVARADAQQPRPDWEVRVAERVEVVPGAQGGLSIAIAVDRGLTVSKDAGVIVDLAADPGLTLKRRRLGRADAVDPEADAPRFSASVRGDTAGEHIVRIRVRFWLCAAKTCRPIDARRTATVAVVAPAPTPPDAGVDAARPDAKRP